MADCTPYRQVLPQPMACFYRLHLNNYAPFASMTNNNYYATFFLEIIPASIVLPAWPGRQDGMGRESSLRSAHHARLMVRRSALHDAV